MKSLKTRFLPKQSEDGVSKAVSSTTRTILNEFYCCDFVFSPLSLKILYWVGIFSCAFLFLISFANVLFAILVLSFFQNKILDHVSDAIPIVFLIIPLVEGVLSTISPSYLNRMYVIRKRANMENDSNSQYNYNTPAEELSRTQLYRTMHLLSSILLLLVVSYVGIGLWIFFYTQKLIGTFNEDLINSFNNYTRDFELKKVRPNHQIKDFVLISNFFI